MYKKITQVLDRVSPGVSRSLGWEVAMSALAFPASVMLNRTLGAEERGLLALTILVPLTVFSLGSCQWDRLVKGLISAGQISSREAWRRTVYYAKILTLIFVPVGVVASLVISQSPLHNSRLSALYCFNFPIYFLCGCLSAIYVAVGSIDGQYLMRIGLQGSYLVLLFSFLFFKTISVETVVLIYVVIHGVSLAIGWSWKRRLLNGDVFPNRPPLTPLAKAFLPYATETFSSRMDSWAFSLFGSMASLGQYVGIAALMLPVGLVSNALTSGSTARLDWTNPKLVQRYLIKTLMLLVILLVVLVSIGILIGPYILNLLLGKSFEAGRWMIPWIALVVVGQSASVQFHSALQLSGNLSAYLTVQIIEPATRLVLVLALGWLFSEMGILLGLAISSFLKIIVCLHFFAKIYSDNA